MSEDNPELVTDLSADAPEEDSAEKDTEEPGAKSAPALETSVVVSKEEDLDPPEGDAVSKDAFTIRLDGINLAFSDDEIEWEDEDGDDEVEIDGEGAFESGGKEPVSGSGSKKSQRGGKEPVSGSGSKKSQRAGKDKEPVRRKRRSKRRQVELLFLLAQCLLYNDQCDNRGLQTSFSAEIPEPFRLDPCSFRLKKLRSFLRWFQLKYKKFAAPAGSNTRATKLGRLPGIVQSMQASKLERVQIFVLLLRAMEVPARIVFCLFPREKASASAPKKGKASRDDDRPHVWAEVWVATEGSKGRWVHVSVNEKAGIDSPSFYHAALGQGGFTSRKKVSVEAAYIVALSQFNYAVDVTMRYTSRPSTVHKRRVGVKGMQVAQFHTGYKRQSKAEGNVKVCWWEGYVLAGLRHEAASTAVMKEDRFESAEAFKILQQAMSEEAFESERKELQASAMSEEIPTSEEGFRHHAKYVLEKHLRKHEAIRPSAEPVTFFKGQKVFTREDVAVLFSRKKWKLAGRQVKEEELDLPMKQWKWKKRKLRRNTENENPEEATMNLYSKEQTVEMKRPHLVNNELPKNKYGNVEIFCDKMVPIGAEVIDNSFALRAAKQLDVDYVRVVTGFDGRYPKFEGILVLENAAVLVRDAAHQLRQESLTKKRQQKTERVLKRWKLLVNQLVQRKRLSETYQSTAMSNSIDLTQEADEPAQPQPAVKRRKTCNHDFKDHCDKEGASGSNNDENSRVRIQKCTLCDQVRESETL